MTYCEIFSPANAKMYKIKASSEVSLVSLILRTGNVFLKVLKKSRKFRCKFFVIQEQRSTFKRQKTGLCCLKLSTKLNERRLIL